MQPLSTSFLSVDTSPRTLLAPSSSTPAASMTSVCLDSPIRARRRRHACPDSPVTSCHSPSAMKTTSAKSKTEDPDDDSLAARKDKAAATKPKVKAQVLVRLPVPRVDKFQITTDTPLTLGRSSADEERHLADRDVEGLEEIISFPLRKAVSLTSVSTS